METFFSDADYREYLYLMAEWCNRCKVQVLSYCLMPNHVHLKGEDDILVKVGLLLAIIPDWQGF